MKKNKGAHKNGRKIPRECRDEFDVHEDINQMIAALEEENRQLKSRQWLIAGLGVFLGASLFGGDCDCD